MKVNTIVLHTDSKLRRVTVNESFHVISTCLDTLRVCKLSLCSLVACVYSPRLASQADDWNPKHSLNMLRVNRVLIVMFVSSNISGYIIMQR
jgi:hypothetical protein